MDAKARKKAKTAKNTAAAVRRAAVAALRPRARAPATARRYCVALALYPPYSPCTYPAALAHAHALAGDPPRHAPAPPTPAQSRPLLDFSDERLFSFLDRPAKVKKEAPTSPDNELFPTCLKPYPLHTSVWHNAWSAVHVLLRDGGASPNEKTGDDLCETWLCSTPAIIIAADMGHLCMLQCLVAAGADIRLRGGTEEDEGLTACLLVACSHAARA